jgi:hypothetical protein
VKLALAANLRPKPLAIIAIFASVSLIFGYIFDPLVKKHSNDWQTSFVKRQRAGFYLRENFPPSTLVALNAAGIIPYYSQLATIDMLGLNDIHIAHQGKRDKELRYGHQVGDGLYVLSREPDVILFGGLARKPGSFISDQEIWHSPQFQANYDLQEWQGIGYAYVKNVK